MRLGLDLRRLATAEQVSAAARADQLGLWAVLIGAPSGAESAVAAEVAIATDHVHIAVHLDATDAHPLALAEEVAIVDHLSARRALAVIDGPEPAVVHTRRLLAGEIVNGSALTPPPAQTLVPVWSADSIAVRALTGQLDTDRQTIDDALGAGVTHLFVTWPGKLGVLARHLAARALAPGFPTIVADYADQIAPITDD